MRKLVLFDIDGTILWTDGAGRRAIKEALIAEMGTAGPIDNGYRLDGKTDPQIVRELMMAANHPHAGSEAHTTRVLQRYVEALGRELQAAGKEARVFPGVETLIDELERRGDAVVGLLTGNVVGGANLKLRAVGVDPARFLVGAFGSDAGVRSDLPPIAVKRAESFMGRVPHGEEVVIIGDTPADVTCGQCVNARAIGVGTGHYSAADLSSAGAFASFADLSGVDAVLDAIYR